ncbi:MAG: AAA family ATPase [Theionarchaea archaeon]|nr:AAA family ATPase [Theionarchaea archaeon]
MKVTGFRIRNYGSMEDSGDCHLDGKITVLAGKNEAGKTKILEALEDFNINTPIRESAIPIWAESKTPEISISISLDKEEYQKTKEKFKTMITGKEITVEIIKKYPSNNYILSEESLMGIDPAFGFMEDKKKRITEIMNLIGERDESFLIDKERLENPQQLYSLIQGYIPEFIENLDKIEKKEMNQKIEELKTSSKELSDLIIFQKDITEFIKQNFLPNFILFKSFEDMLPNQISISEAPNNPLVRDLSLISSLDFDTVNPETPPRKREMHRDEVNLRFSEDYRQFWSQDHSNLYVSWDSENIYFWLKEGKQYYTPEMRSKGKQWHLAFYIKVTARSLEERGNMILIDEPGLFLHAKAQKDILKKLEECSERIQLLYTTHSPYSISSDKLDRVRLVIKPDEGFTTIRKITAKADKETLTPILTAIGEDLTIGIRTDRKNSIVLEGFSDYLYLIAFKKLLDIEEELNFIPATGGETPIYVGSILFGWGLDPIFILDNDNQGKKVMRKLKERLSIDEERIILLPENGEGSIENLFSGDDFMKFVNSEGHGKVLSGQIFSQKIERNEIKISDLSSETVENFKRVFHRLTDLAND